MPRVLPVEQLASIVELMGLSIEQLRQQAERLGLDAAALDGVPGKIISSEDFGRLFIAVLREAQLQAGVTESALDDVLSLSSYRVLFSYILHAPTLGGSLARAASYFSRFELESRSFSISTEGETARWQFELGPIDPVDVPGIEHFSMEQLQWLPGLPGRMMALYLWHRTASWMTANFIDVLSVHFDCPPLGAANDYAGSFGGPVYFNSDWCGMQFHSRYLQAPIVQNEEGLERMLSTFPAELIEVDTLASSMASRVRGLLGSDFSVELPSLEEVASRLFTTPATLHRRLREEGTSFQKLKDHCRRDAAVLMLRDGQHSGAELAEYLGFSDPSTFYRAFKKWTGMTPQEFRARGA